MKKVTKNTIKSMIGKLNEGEYIEVALLPCKVNWENCWAIPVWVKITSLENLENIIAHFEYYYGNNELGKYPSYYIAE